MSFIANLVKCSGKKIVHIFSVLFILGLLPVSSNAQLLQWNTFGNAGTETIEPSVFNDINILASNLTLGAGVTPAANGNRFGGNDWFTSNGSLAEAVAGNDYIEFIVTPNAGYSFTPTSFVFNWERSGTGPSNVTLRSSVNAFSSDIGTITGLAASLTTGNSITISGISNLTTATTFRLYGYGATATGGTGGFDVASSVVNVQLNGTSASIGIVSASNGDWFTGSTWVGGIIPNATQNVRILHNLTSNAVTRNAGTITVVETGSSLTMNGTYTNDGNTFINGTFQLNNGGYANGNNNFFYALNSYLVFNNGSTYDVNAGQRFWPAINQPYNVTVNTGSNANLNDGARSIPGTMNLYGGFINNGGLTVNGILQINQNGYVSIQSPVYGSSSLLRYNTNTNPYNNGWEWSSSTIAANVQLSGNTVLNYPAIGIAARTITGNLTIDAGSALYMDYGAPMPGVSSLAVGGNVGIAGALSLGNQFGGDLKVGGDINFNPGYTFNANNRAVFFTKNGTQTITASSTPTFHYLVFEPVSGNNTVVLSGTDLNITAPSAGNVISFGAGNILDINDRTLTLGTTGVANVLNGTGSFKGSISSNLNLLGTGNIGTINFTPGSQNLGSFTLNRTLGGAATLGTSLSIGNSLNLTEGLLTIGANHLTLGAAATVGGTPSVIAMVVADGVGEFRKTFSGTGSFLFPVGDDDNPDGTQYSPATVNFTSGTFAGGNYVGIKITDAVHPFIPVTPDNYITRYWSLSSLGITGAINYSFTGTCLPADEATPITDAFSGQWDGTNWTDGNALAGNIVIVSNLNVLSPTNDFTAAKITARSHYFRSNILAGNWNNKLSWQSSKDGITWVAATNYPTSAANSILIRNTHTITLVTAASAKMLTIETGATLTNAGPGGGYLLTIADDAAGVDLKIYGTYHLFGIQPVLSGLATAEVFSTAVVRAMDNLGPMESDDFARSTAVIFLTGAVFDWNNTNTFEFSGYTYFPNAGVNVAIFRVSQNPGTPGGGTTATINGILQVNSSFTFVGGAAKIFRNGITGSAILTQNNTVGNSFNITAANAILGGSSLSIILNSPLNLSISTIVPTDSIVTISGGNINNVSGTITVNGILDITNISITNTSGTVTVNGTIRTSNTGGFTGAGSIPSGTVILNNTSSTVEYYANANQPVTSRADYYNLILSGSGIKNPSSAFNPSGTVTITGSAIFDCTGNNIGNATTSLTMTGGRLIVSTAGTQPAMGNLYILSGGVVEFAGAGSETIRTQTYFNIEVTGAGIGNSLGNITLNSGGSFTIKSGGIFEINDDAIVGPVGSQTVTVENGGIFRTGDVHGFSGGTGVTATSVRNDVEIINLLPGSTVEYSKATGASQVITNQVIAIPVNANYHHLVISGTGIKTAPSSTLTVQGNLSKSGTSTFAHNNGLVLLNGANQNFAGLDYYGLEMTGSTKTTFGDASITDVLQLNANTILALQAGDSISLKSTAAKTARVGQLGAGASITYGNTSTSKFVVERFIRSGRKWRYLSIPTDDANQTFKTSWQEGATSITQNPKPTYGTIIGDPGTNWSANGFDLRTPVFPSVKTYVAASNSYIGIPATNQVIQSMGLGTHPAFFAFIQGDRTITTTASTSSTTLRTAGKLFVNNQSVSVAGTEVKGIGNPYASPVNMIAAIDPTNAANGLVNAYQVWDPQGTGGIGFGNFQALVWDGTNFTVTPGGGSYGAQLSAHNNIESGLGFFVKGNGGGTINFTEAAKNVVATSVSFTPGMPQMLRGNLYINPSNSDPVLMDGFLVNFDSNYSNTVDGNDIPKMMNTGENAGIKTHETILIVERHASISNNDTLHINITNIRIQNYQWEIILDNMDYPGRTAFLIDRYLQSSTPLKMTDTSIVNFNVENIAGSYAEDRFIIVFRQTDQGPVPVTITTLSASRKDDRSIEVLWKVENETNISGYEVQRSADGSNFTGIKNKTALANNGGKATYNHIDLVPLPGDNFYRIKAIGINGSIQYSYIVKVSALKQSRNISVYPNPVADGNVQVRFNGQPAGKYQLQLSNAAGQVIYQGNISVTGIMQSQDILLPANITSGSYQLRVNAADGTITVLQVLVK